MNRSWLVAFCLLLLPALAAAADKGPAKNADEAKELSGMSIVGNDEAPKSLYIVPWKSAELGTQAGLDMTFDEEAVPVDPDVFMRQLAYDQIRRGTPATTAGSAGNANQQP